MKGLDNYPWEIRGTVYIFIKDNVTIVKDAGIRFGEHGYMQGFRLCLATYFENDDKHELEHARACHNSRTIMGTIRSYSVVFQINKGQVQKMKQFLQSKTRDRIVDLEDIYGAELNGFYD